MEGRNVKRGAAVPFYSTSRRKTSAEIISEARAAIEGDMSFKPSGPGLGALRPLRTRRPFTPREPQRTLFTERSHKRDVRPPSSFDLKYLTLSEDGEDKDVEFERIKSFDDEYSDKDDVLRNSQQSKTRTKIRSLQSVTDQVAEGWSGFMRLPHLSGKSKPLHRRSNPEVGNGDVHHDLSQAILVTRSLADGSQASSVPTTTSHGKKTKSLSPNQSGRRKQYANGKPIAYEGSGTIGHVGVRSLEVQIPSAKIEILEHMSMLDIAEMLNQRSRDMDRVLRVLEVLQKTLEKTPPATSLRDLVLRSLYSHIDSDDERVLVGIARAMLTMRVTGSHLSSACKLVFKVARNDKNDHFFLNGNLLELLVEGCGRLDPVTECECCVYAAGALRFLTLEPRLCEIAHRVGALHIAALHLKLLNNAISSGKCEDGVAQALYQVAGALRGLAGYSPSAFANSGVLPELLGALAAHTHRDVITNVARCLSVLSAEATCCAELCARPGATRALLAALSACGARASLAVRLAYTLGNMAAADPRTALHIYNEDGAVDVLLTILESYTQRIQNNVDDPEYDRDLHLFDSDLGGSNGSNEDVLIKTIRVLANLCLAEQAGRGMATTHVPRAVAAMMACLKLVEKSYGADDESEEIKRNREDVCCELATASLAALNNVSFYMQPATTHTLNDVTDELCIVSCRWLRSELPGVAEEAARVLGNVSRSQRAAKLLVLHGALHTLTALHEHDEASVRCAAAGVLVNVCGCGGADACVSAAGAAAGALDSAARAGDAGTAVLLARALWNAHANKPLEQSDAKRAAAALALFVDDESVFAACEMSTYGVRQDLDPQRNSNLNFEKDYIKDVKHSSISSNSMFHKIYKDGDDELLDEDVERNGSGEDLGFEEGEMEECECGPCQRLAAWDELMGVAIPLLEKLKPLRTDAAVGTD